MKRLSYGHTQTVTDGDTETVSHGHAKTVSYGATRLPVSYGATWASGATWPQITAGRK